LTRLLQNVVCNLYDKKDGKESMYRTTIDKRQQVIF